MARTSGGCTHEDQLGAGDYESPCRNGRAYSREPSHFARRHFASLDLDVFSELALPISCIGGILDSVHEFLNLPPAILPRSRHFYWCCRRQSRFGRKLERVCGSPARLVTLCSRRRRRCIGCRSGGGLWLLREPISLGLVLGERREQGAASTVVRRDEIRFRVLGEQIMQAAMRL